jgi:chromosome segregation ATPase
MRLRARLLAPAIAVCVLATILLPARAHAEASAGLTTEQMEQLLSDYEVRLRAHRRELLDREAALEKAKRTITKLRKPRFDRPQPTSEPQAAAPTKELEESRRESRAEIARLQATIAALNDQLRKSGSVVAQSSAPRDEARIQELERSERAARAEIVRLQAKNEALEAELAAVMALANRSPNEAEPRAERDAALVISLRHELDVERENRATIERELERLVSAARFPERSLAVSRSLDDARAEIMLLNERLAHEHRARESLEITVTRVRRIVEIGAGDDWVDRFEATMNERREQAERLQEELHNANESIVSLKSKLETAAVSAPAPAVDVRGLEDDVKKLRDALQTAQQANADLRAQAELAARLAELLYAQSR